MPKPAKRSNKPAKPSTSVADARGDSSAESVVDFAEIRRRREALTFSMDEAGQAAGQSPARARQWWNDVESGRYDDPRISKLVAVARALRCGIDDLLLPDARPRTARR